MEIFNSEVKKLCNKHSLIVEIEFSNKCKFSGIVTSQEEVITMITRYFYYPPIIDNITPVIISITINKKHINEEILKDYIKYLSNTYSYRFFKWFFNKD